MHIRSTYLHRWRRAIESSVAGHAPRADGDLPNQHVQGSVVLGHPCHVDVSSPFLLWRVVRAAVRRASARERWWRRRRGYGYCTCGPAEWRRVVGVGPVGPIVGGPPLDDGREAVEETSLAQSGGGEEERGERVEQVFLQVGKGTAIGQRYESCAPQRHQRLPVMSLGEELKCKLRKQKGDTNVPRTSWLWSVPFHRSM